MIIKHYVYLLLSCIALAGCNHSEQQKTVTSTETSTAVTKAHAVMAPFRYHKSIEVAPGQTYDVLSWGRGSDSVGAYEILRSDSADKKFTTTTGDLEGRIVDVLNSDMDTDGNPEIFIQTEATDTLHTSVVYAYEYNETQVRKLDFPKLTRSQRKGYHGKDNFYIKDDKLMREFMAYSEPDSNNNVIAQKRVLAYNLRGNELSVEEVKQDTTQKQILTAQPKATEKPQTEKSPSSTNTRQATTSSSRSNREEHSSSRRHHREERTSRRHESPRRHSSSSRSSRRSESRHRRHRR